jgi:hypothetical protein
MGFAFNPFTGNFDLKGSGGGGASYIDGEVATFNDLPLDGSAPLDNAWLVREASGTWLIARKPAGIYIRTATGGTDRDADWTYAGILPDVFSDANFLLYDDADSSKNLAFQLSGITTGTTRTLTVPDKNITLDDATDSRTPTSHASSHAAAGSDPVFDQDLNSDDSVTFADIQVTGGLLNANGIGFEGDLKIDLETNTLIGNFAILDGALGFDGDDAATNAATTRTNLGLGDSATADIGTTAGTVAAGDDSRFSDIPDPSAATPQALGTAAAGTSDDYSRGDHVHPVAGLPIEYVIACSDETSDLTTGTAKVTFRAPVAFLLTAVAASVNTAPTGSTLIVDINNGADSTLSTKLSIDASEKTSATAASAAVIDTDYDDIAADAEITIDIDQVGSTIAGKGLKVILKGTRA